MQPAKEKKRLIRAAFFLLSDPQLPERHCPGGCHIQRIHAVVHGNDHRMVAAVDGLLGQRRAAGVDGAAARQIGRAVEGVTVFFTDFTAPCTAVEDGFVAEGHEGEARHHKAGAAPGKTHNAEAGQRAEEAPDKGSEPAAEDDPEYVADDIHASLARCGLGKGRHYRRLEARAQEGEAAGKGCEAERLAVYSPPNFQLYFLFGAIFL